MYTVYSNNINCNNQRFSNYLLCESEICSGPRQGQNENPNGLGREIKDNFFLLDRDEEKTDRAAPKKNYRPTCLFIFFYHPQFEPIKRLNKPISLIKKNSKVSN